MDDFFTLLSQEVPAIQLKKGQDLSLFSSFKMGGRATLFATIDKLDELIKLVQLSWREGVDVRVLGSGTGSVIDDQGFEGLVIKNNCRRFELQGMKGKFVKNKMVFSQGFLYAEAGAITNQAVRFVIDQGFGGIEFALGLPGTVGGAVAVNANYVKEEIAIGRAVYAAKILTKDGIIDVDHDYLKFAFDSSRILDDKSIILSILFALYPEDKKKLWERADAAASYRMTTQPTNQGAGITFRNMRLTTLYPNFSLPSGVTCEFLLEKAGLLGYRLGDVEIWKENPRFLINRGSATLQDTAVLLRHVREAVKEKFGVQLEAQLLQL